MKKRSKTKKVLAAFAIGILAASSGAFALQSDSDSSDSVLGLTHGSFNDLQQNPQDFVKITNLDFQSDFDYFKELNKEFVDPFENKFSGAVDEASVRQALMAGDYESWKSAVGNLEGFPSGLSYLPKEEFAILVNLRNLDNSNKPAK